ncbi:hypothetical protein CR152_10450 [Massilia violaceinigra]|uniref:Uncharacterized protein n=1 Tax=Massilia violaceinigra TaxID=2045208 RepID=A0A2D2DIT8_9BURK|nr:hypothetical protein CR152_10450 [Massilia violaceinigra]
MAMPTQQNAQLLHLAGLAGLSGWWQWPSSMLATTWLATGTLAASHSADDAAAKPCKGIASSNSQISNVLKDVMGKV